MSKASGPIDSRYDKAGSKSRSDLVRPKRPYSLFLLEHFHELAHRRRRVRLCELQDELVRWGRHL